MSPAQEKVFAASVLLITAGASSFRHAFSRLKKKRLMTERCEILKNRLPLWFRQEIPRKIVFDRLELVSRLNLHTVCQEAKCPNLSYCFGHQHLTFLLLGDTCTRNCRFCAVKKNNPRNLRVDLDEPYRIAKAVKELTLDYVVLTSVTRDDLADRGAGIFVQTINLIRAINPGVRVEVLIPDFQGNPASLKVIVDSHPDLLAHNLETVARLYPDLRPLADYDFSLRLFSQVKALSQKISTKSSLMLGLGEREEEVVSAMQDLRKHQCDYLALGQYLAPSIEHYPVKEFISIEQFEKYRQIALSLDFKGVLSGPLVRSSSKLFDTFGDKPPTLGVRESEP